MGSDLNLYIALGCIFLMNIVPVVTECNSNSHYDLTTTGIPDEVPHAALACQGLPFFPRVEPMNRKYFRLKSGTSAALFLAGSSQIYDRYNENFYQIEIPDNDIITIRKNEQLLSPIVGTAPAPPDLLSATDFADLWIAVIPTGSNSVDGNIQLGLGTGDSADSNIASWYDSALYDVNYILIQTYDDTDVPPNVASWEFCDGALKLLSGSPAEVSQRDTDTSAPRDKGDADNAVDGNSNNGIFDENVCTAIDPECYTMTDGTDYRGYVSETMNGNQCQKWTSQSPRTHGNTPADKPDSGLGFHNYCRNPDGDAGGPWCYTIDTGEPRFEFCNVGAVQGSCDDFAWWRIDLMDMYHVKAVSTINSLIPTPTGNLCDKGWRRLGAGCYLEGFQSKTWDAAEADCVVRGGHLASVAAPEIQAFFENWLQHTTDTNGYWIGLEEGPAAEFTWINNLPGFTVTGGTPGGAVTPTGYYTNWATDAPSGEGCVLLRLGDSDNEWKWGDEPCANTRKYICQQSICPANSLHFGEYCYRMKTTTATLFEWQHAQQECADEFTDNSEVDSIGLITVNSAMKQAFLVAWLEPPNNNGPEVWIGLNQIATEGEWRWDAGDDPGFDWTGGVSGSGGVADPPSAYQNWNNDGNAQPTGQADCAELRDDGSGGELFTDLDWNDNRCDFEVDAQSRRYICQIRYPYTNTQRDNLLNAEVRVGSCDHTKETDSDPLLAIIKQNEVCESSITSGESLLDRTGFWILRECDVNYYGQYVYILKENTNDVTEWFSLCETEVWGVELSDEKKPKLGFSVSESGLEDALDTKTFTVTKRDGSAEHPTCLGFELKLIDEVTATNAADYTINPATLLNSVAAPSYQYEFYGDVGESLSVDVTFVDNDCEEPDEVVGFTFSRLSPGVCAGDADISTFNDQITYTLLNDDATYSWENTAISVFEGDVTATGILRRTGYTAGVTTAYVTTTANTATANTDFVPILASTSQSEIGFGIGSTTMPVVVTILEDSDCELPPAATETFSLVVSPTPAACTTTGADLTVTILPDDSQFQFTSIPSDSRIIPESNSLFEVVVERIGNTDRNEEVGVISQSITNPSATPDDDYQTVTETLRFPTGATTASVTVTLRDDNLEELSEFFNLILVRNPLALPECVVNPTQKEITFEITDDDCTWSMMVPEVSIIENDGPVDVTVMCVRDDGVTIPRTRTADLRIDSSAVTDGTAATEGFDFTTSSITSVTIAAGETSATISLPITDDSMEETVEYFDVTLVSSDDGGIAEESSTRVAINDDDVTVTISSCEAPGNTVLENSGELLVTLNRTGDTSGMDTVLLFTNPITASAGSTAGVGDYVSLNENVDFLPTVSSVNRKIIINKDSEYESDETFVVQLQKQNADTSVHMSIARCVVTIQDDDCIISFAPTNGNRYVSEDADYISFTITRYGFMSTGADVRIDTSILNDPPRIDATPGRDYDVTSRIVTFGPGQSTQTINIAIKEDNIPETDEYFAVTLSGDDCRISGESTIVIGIKDNDEVRVAMQEDSVTVNENEEFALATVIRTGASLDRTDVVTLSVLARAVTGSSTAATRGSDFVSDDITVTFGPNEESKVIGVPIVDDDMEESGLESFVVQIREVTQVPGGGTNARIDIPNSETLVYIRDDDGEFYLRSLGRYSEGVGTIPVTVDRTGPTTSEEFVYISTKDGGATSSDYQPLKAAPLRFQVGMSTASLNLVILQDKILEPTEDFLVCWSLESDGTADECIEIVSIEDDDNEIKFVATLETIESENSITVTESDTMAQLTVQRSGYGSSRPTGTTIVGIATRETTRFLANGLSKADENFDYRYTGQTVTFVNGETRKDILIDIVDDNIVETREVFDVVLTDVSPEENNVLAHPTRFTVYITDDDGVGGGSGGITDPPGGADGGDGDTGGVSQLFIIIVGGVAGLVLLLAFLGLLGCAILFRLRGSQTPVLPPPQGRPLQGPPTEARPPRGPPPGYYAQRPQQGQFRQPRPLGYRY